MLTVSYTVVMLLSKIVNLIRAQVVSDAVSSRAVVLMLIHCLLFLPFFFCLLGPSFSYKVLAYHNAFCLLNRRLY